MHGSAPSVRIDVSPPVGEGAAGIAFVKVAPARNNSWGQMATLTPEEVIEKIVERVSDSHPGDLETDLHGQLLVYTGIFRHSDGTYHNEEEDITLSPEDIPADWPVQPIKQGKSPIVTCGACGLSWDDSKVTSMTPTPSARCPFEQFHKDS